MTNIRVKLGSANGQKRSASPRPITNGRYQFWLRQFRIESTSKDSDLNPNLKLRYHDPLLFYAVGF